MDHKAVGDFTGQVGPSGADRLLDRTRFESRAQS